MIIKYRGGPLNRQSFTGPSNQPKYRDARGIPIPYREGADSALALARRQESAARAAAYLYDWRHCRYDFIGTLLAETATERIARLNEEKAEHPERADEIEQQIREIEASAA